MTGGRTSPNHSEDPSDYEVFERLYPMLRRFAAVVADLDVDPDDLVQEALTATLRRNELSEIRHPAAYLKQAILNAAGGHRRRAGRLRRLLPRLLTESVSTDRYPSDLSVLDSLAPMDRAVVFMADVEGVPHALIAEELGITVGAVKKRASRSRKQLRELLRPDLAPISSNRQGPNDDDRRKDVR